MTKVALGITLGLLLVSLANASVDGFDLPDYFGDDHQESNMTTVDDVQGSSRNGWLPASGTFYGDPNGAGTDGGACGYLTLPGTPYGSSVTAVSDILFRNGFGCGACYLVKCIGPYCAPKPVRVVVTDQSPPKSPTHFDLSGFAAQRMALPGQGPALLNTGDFRLSYTKVPCRYPTRGIVVQPAAGAGDYWFSAVIRYVGGPGQIDSAALQTAGSSQWKPMTHSWGALWAVTDGSQLVAPFSIRLTSGGRTIVANNVIPSGWRPGVPYQSNVNF